MIAKRRVGVGKSVPLNLLVIIEGPLSLLVLIDLFIVESILMAEGRSSICL